MSSKFQYINKIPTSSQVKIKSCTDASQNIVFWAALLKGDSLTYFLCRHFCFFPLWDREDEEFGWGVFLFVSRRKWLHTDEALIHQVQSHHRTALPRCTPSTIKTPKSSLCPEATGAPALVQPHQWDPESWEADMLQPKFKLIFSSSCKRWGGEKSRIGKGACLWETPASFSPLFSFFSPLTVVCLAPRRCPISFSRLSKQISEMHGNDRSSFSFITHFITPHCQTDTRDQIEHMSVCILTADAPFSCRCEDHPPGPFQGALPFLYVCSCLFSFNRSTSRTPPNHSRRREAPPHTSFTCCTTRQEQLGIK